MSMFCYQCQETAKNEGCTIRGVCGKNEPTANLQDLLVHILKGISIYGEKSEPVDKEAGRFIMESLFATITNANFDDDRFVELIEQALVLRDKVKAGSGVESTHDAAVWTGSGKEVFLAKAPSIGVLATENEDVRSLRELIIYGLKGMAAYTKHAEALDKEDDALYSFVMEALAATTKDLSVDELVALTLKTGEMGVTAMATLDAANTESYGNPELTEVNIGVSDTPGILISGHDLKDMEMLLEQTQGTGVDVYTHSEMLPAHYYPKFKEYSHLVGNYGGSWWRQNQEFDEFNGPILMTTNCIVPPREDYQDRLYTTGMSGYPGAKHILDAEPGKQKDFSAIIEHAKTCKSPVQIESGTITGGFAHNQVMALADKVVDAVKSGAIKRFVVMAGCDGRQRSRNYFTEVAEQLPEGTVILTAGCAKYRYNKLDLGDIGGIPRVLDAGQCNDSYSLAVIAMKLQEVFGLDDINDLPISYDIAWYEQKAVIVLLALLFLGVKGIRLGPTLPGFLSANVAKVLVENFDIKPIGTVDDDIEAMMAGK